MSFNYRQHGKDRRRTNYNPVNFELPTQATLVPIYYSPYVSDVLVADDILYIGYDHIRPLYAQDLQGNKLWEILNGYRYPELACVDKNGRCLFGYGDPATFRLYIACVFNGNILWTSRVDNANTIIDSFFESFVYDEINDYLYCSFLIHDGTVYTRFVCKINSSGSVIGRFNSKDISIGALSDGVLYCWDYTNVQKNLIRGLSLNVESLWSTPIRSADADFIHNMCLITLSDRVFVCFQEWFQGTIRRCKLLCISDSGSILWSKILDPAVQRICYNLQSERLLHISYQTGQITARLYDAAGNLTNTKTLAYHNPSYVNALACLNGYEVHYDYGYELRILKVDHLLETVGVFYLDVGEAAYNAVGILDGTLDSLLLLNAEKSYVLELEVEEFKVVSTVPNQDANNVDPDIVIKVTFSDSLDIATISHDTLQVYGWLPEQYEYQWTYNDATKTLALTIPGGLETDASIIVNLTAGLKSTGGVALTPYALGFSTAKLPLQCDPPVILEPQVARCAKPVSVLQSPIPTRARAKWRLHFRIQVYADEAGTQLISTVNSNTNPELFKYSLDNGLSWWEFPSTGLPKEQYGAYVAARCEVGPRKQVWLRASVGAEDT